MVREYKRTFRHVRRGTKFLPYISYSKEDLDTALQEIREKTISVRQAAIKYGIPKSTLCRRYKDESINEKAGHPTLFYATEENAFLRHCEVLGEWGFPLDTLDLRIMAQKYLNKIGKTVHSLKDNLPGRDWAQNFMKRHKDRLSHRFAANISTARAKLSSETIDAFFENYMNTVEGVPPEKIINYDETNLCDDPGAKKYVFKRGTKYPERIINNSKTAVSLMFTGTADGQMLPIYVVYKAEHLWDTWLEGGPPDTRYNRAKSGWFDITCFEDWFETVIVPYTKKKPGKTVVIGDNLSSHFSEKTLQTCQNLNISFVCLPPKSTHLMQPLDVAFYGPLKKYWKEILTNWKATAEGRKHKTLIKSTFPRLLTKLYELMNEKGVISANITAGFEKSGLFPVNADRPKSRLPRAQPSTEEVNASTSEVVINILQEMRGFNETAVPTKRRKRCEVQPGKSITAQDITPKPTKVTSAKGNGQGKKSKTDKPTEDPTKENDKPSHHKHDKNKNKKKNQAKTRQNQAELDSGSETTSVSDNISEHSDSDLMDTREDYNSDVTTCSTDNEFLISYFDDKREPRPGPSGESLQRRKVQSRPDHNKVSSPDLNEEPDFNQETAPGFNEELISNPNEEPAPCPNEDLVKNTNETYQGPNEGLLQDPNEEAAPGISEDQVQYPNEESAAGFNEKLVKDPNEKRAPGPKEKLEQDSNEEAVPGPYEAIDLFAVNEKVLVRYYLRKTWKYYVGVVEIIDNHLYTISFYRTVLKNDDIIFVKPKKDDRDTLPEISLVKTIDIVQVSIKPERYSLSNKDDMIYWIP